VAIALNVLVFFGWQIPDKTVHVLFLNNFLVSPLHLSHGYWWTLLTAAFSQAELWHLAVNMIVLFSFGSVLERLLSTRLFVGFYLVTALVSSASHCFVSAVLLGSPNTAALGASGVMSGILVVYALLFPKHRILVFGLIPIPALVGAIAFAGLDLVGLFAQSLGGGLRIGHGAHLGGAACGVLMYLVVLRPHLQQLQLRHACLTLGLTPAQATEFDRLRTKVAEQGRDSLTPKEQYFLQQVFHRFRPQPGDEPTSEE